MRHKDELVIYISFAYSELKVLLNILQMLCFMCPCLAGTLMHRTCQSTAHCMFTFSFPPCYTVLQTILYHVHIVLCYSIVSYSQRVHTTHATPESTYNTCNARKYIQCI